VGDNRHSQRSAAAKVQQAQQSPAVPSSPKAAKIQFGSRSRESEATDAAGLIRRRATEARAAEAKSIPAQRGMEYC
jgi:hypothetical protein